jgi:hypothetical protein
MLVFLAAACGAGDRRASPGSEPPPAALTAAEPAGLYEADATVLDDREHGPMLCLGAVRTSLPPRCGDVPLEGWDWGAVEGAESFDGTTWGAYHVVGTYDGAAFTVTGVGPFVDEPFEDLDLSSPCPEPAGGWPVIDAERSTQEYAHAAARHAEGRPDYVASWVTHLRRDGDELGPVVFNALFTGDVARHEAELREVYVGPLCVVESPGPTARELARIRREAEAGLDELGLRMLWSQIPGVEPVVEIGVVADPDGAGQAAFDERYGRGIVRLTPGLVPVR